MEKVVGGKKDGRDDGTINFRSTERGDLIGLSEE